MSQHQKIRLKFERLIRFIVQENIHSILLVVLVIILVSAIAISLLEPEINFVNGIWWSIVTLTTVGYGDISPSTIGGRIIAVLIMFFGIGLLGTLSASLATLLIFKRMKENRGMCGSDVEKHIIICEWNYRTEAILEELRADPKTAKSPIVLIADLEHKPVDDPNLIFINGSVNEKNLNRANLQKASTVIVLGCDDLEATARDAKVVLTTLTIESLNPDVYTVVELVDKTNEQHCRRAHADEIIIGSELTSHLLATAAINHGMSRIVHELLSNQYGNELYAIPTPAEYVGLDFLEVLIRMKKEHASTVLGVQNNHQGELTTNPDNDYSVKKNDYLLVIAKERLPG
jgi:voltage-gated potassium channel